MPAYNNTSLTSTASPLVVPTTAGVGMGGSRITLTYFNLSNPNSSLIYVQFFDAASATGITVGTSAPDFFIAVPANGGCIDTPLNFSYPFKKGIVVAATTTPTGSGNPASPGTIQIFTKP